MTPQKILRKTLKITLWVFGVLTGLLLIAILLLQIPPVQHYLTDKAVNFLEDKLKTRVALAGINVGFPKFVVLNGVYIEDLQKDTLLYSQRLAVDMDFFALRDNKVTINTISVNNLSANIKRSLPDSLYNFDFIIKAFSDSVNVTEEDTAATPWKISIDKIK
ncbi:MAG: hypothetical protein H7Y04_14960 [Verrucomicrobia bacterium]|nr:hypothetical protein [Cytophagales bacterium]